LFFDAFLTRKFFDKLDLFPITMASLSDDRPFLALV